MHTHPTGFLANSATQVLQQLSRLAQQLGNHRYSEPLELLNGNSIGKHYRHVIEFFQCLQNNDDQLNYDERARSSELETNAVFAVEILDCIIHSFTIPAHDRGLVYKADFSGTGEEGITAATSYHRELAYNIEHAVHHMAIIQMAVKHCYPAIQLEDNFGVAASTLRYRQSVCAQ